jgi:adenosylcobinamide-phosphate synthase
MDIWIFSIILLAVFIDILLGELPAQLHPVVWMGKLIQFIKPDLLKIKSKWSGFILTLILTITFTFPVLILIYYLKFDYINYIIYILISGFILSTTFSIKMLITSSKDIALELKLNKENARQKVSYLVSRDTKNLDDSQIISATVESLTENITDSIVSPLLFSFVLGVPGAMFYRVVNTLDAMVGYKNEENDLIGWFPAKLDDVLNYIPARLTGLIIIFSAFILRMDWKNSYKIMFRDARNTPSPNSGYSMAAAAGALGIKLEKPGVYEIGDNKNKLELETIHYAIKITKVSVFIFLIILMGFTLFLFFFINYF